MSLSIDLLNPPAHSLVPISLAFTHAPAFAIAVDHVMIRLHYIDVCNSSPLNGLIMSVALDSSLVTRHFITSRFCSFSLGSNLLDLWLDLYPPAVCPWFAFCDIQQLVAQTSSVVVMIKVQSEKDSSGLILHESRCSVAFSSSTISLFLLEALVIPFAARVAK